MKLAHFFEGEGASGVVLLHGFLGSGRNLRTLATRWAERDPRLRILVPDLTGHGASPPFPAEASLESVARDVLETARDAGLTGPLRWTGHSFGGRVALAAGRIAPEQVTRVELLDITPSPVGEAESESARVLEVLVAAPATAKDRTSMRAELAGKVSAPLVEWLLTNLEASPDGGGVHWRIDRAALKRAHPRVLGEDLWDVVEARRFPIRCARGGRSLYVPPADADRMRALGCEVVDFPSGHYVHVEALEALLDWLMA